MVFAFGIIFLIFIIGLIASRKSIRDVFLAGVRFILIAFVVIAAIVWICSEYNSSPKKNTSISSYDHSSYLVAKEKKRKEAIKVGNELLEVTKTLFYNKTCYQAWGETEKLVSEIYRKYEEDMQWADIFPLELLFLIDEGLAEVGDDEVVIFHKIRIWTGTDRIPSWKPAIPIRRNKTVRKTTVPLSQYYYGPQPVKEGYTRSGYIAVVPCPKSGLSEARKILDYRRELEGEELKKYNELLKMYETYESQGFYK